MREYYQAYKNIRKRKLLMKWDKALDSGSQNADEDNDVYEPNYWLNMDGF